MKKVKTKNSFQMQKNPLPGLYTDPDYIFKYKKNRKISKINSSLIIPFVFIILAV